MTFTRIHNAPIHLRALLAVAHLTDFLAMVITLGAYRTGCQLDAARVLARWRMRRTEVQKEAEDHA